MQRSCVTKSKKWRKEMVSMTEQIVLSTRIRLARNYKKYPFLSTINSEQAKAVLQTAKDSVLNIGAAGQEFRFLGAEQLKVEGGVLLERHLISPNLLKSHHPCGVILSKDQKISILLNEEDHLRIQVIEPGYALRQAYEAADRLDDLLEEGEEYAFHPQYGYLTGCPTNIGTGLRASVMLHLPALVLSGRMSELVSTVSKFGITVRGIYGEGSEALGNLFQFSNQVTLGITERETLDKLENVVNQMIDQELYYRQKMKDNDALIDQMYRSYGLLTHSYLLSHQEFMKLWSNVRLGMSLSLIPAEKVAVMNDLLQQCGPYSVLHNHPEARETNARDKIRAGIVRKALKEGT